MSNRLRKHLANGGTPFACRMDFTDGSPCDRKFADARSREMHEKDFNHKRRNPKNMTKQSHKAVVTYNSGGATKREDKVHFIVDFLTPIKGKCLACEDEVEVVPLTGKCSLCDPVLTTLALIRIEKNLNEAEKKLAPKAVVSQDQIDQWANEAPWMHWHGGI